MHMMAPPQRFYAAFLVSGLLGGWLSLTGASPLEETVSTLEEWVETERKITEAKTEWEANKASMENLIEVYEQEIENLEQIIEEAEADTSAAEVRRAELNEQNEAVEQVEKEVRAGIIATEQRLKKLRPLLPAPQQEELRPLFNSLPEDPEKSKLAIGQRIQPLVAILTQVQKFNQAVTVVEGFREFEEGRAIQTEKVFFGLGAAFYVDRANEHAGRAVFGEEGWQWQDDNRLIQPVRDFMEIYQGTQQARYIELPVDVN